MRYVFLFWICFFGFGQNKPTNPVPNNANNKSTTQTPKTNTSSPTSSKPNQTTNPTTKDGPTKVIAPPPVSKGPIIQEDGNVVEEKDTIIFHVLDKESIPKSHIQKAYFYGMQILNACNTSKIIPFKEEDFAANVFRKLEPNYISIICTNVLREYGKFNDMRYVEAIYVEKTKITILRFKCIYEKKYSTKEFRVSFNEQNKIVGIKTLKWVSDFKPNKPKPKPFATEIDPSILDSLNKILDFK